MEEAVDVDEDPAPDVALVPLGAPAPMGTVDGLVLLPHIGHVFLDKAPCTMMWVLSHNITHELVEFNDFTYEEECLVVFDEMEWGLSLEMVRILCWCARLSENTSG